MKAQHILIALAMVAALSMVSCGNNKKAQSQEPTQEEVQEMKQALADSVLAEIDAFANECIIASENDIRIKNIELSEQEKLVKPNYLLDLSKADKLVTKSQKINALAMYMVDYSIRQIYDMPLDEAREVIAKLALDINYPIPFEDYYNHSVADCIKKEYEVCKERGDLAYFWQSQEALGIEFEYLFVNNPDLVFNHITEEQWDAWYTRRVSTYKTIKLLAEYDEEMESLYQFLKNNIVVSSFDEGERVHNSKESTREFRLANKDKYISKRNALLQ